MTVRQLFADGQLFEVSGAGYDPQGHLLGDGRILTPPPAVHALLRAAALASDARLVHRTTGGGLMVISTEGALLVAATKAGITARVPGPRGARGSTKSRSPPSGGR